MLLAKEELNEGAAPRAEELFVVNEPARSRLRREESVNLSETERLGIIQLVRLSERFDVLAEERLSSDILDEISAC